MKLLSCLAIKKTAVIALVVGVVICLLILISQLNINETTQFLKTNYAVFLLVRCCAYAVMWFVIFKMKIVVKNKSEMHHRSYIKFMVLLAVMIMANELMLFNNLWGL